MENLYETDRENIREAFKREIMKHEKNIENDELQIRLLIIGLEERKSLLNNMIRLSQYVEEFIELLPQPTNEVDSENV